MIYFFAADYIKVFKVYKTVDTLLSSPIFFLNILLLVGSAIIFDSLILIIERELRTPIYLLFKSLMNLSQKERRDYFDFVAKKIKKKLFN